MYKPAPRLDGLNTEFIELYNSNPWPEDISGYRLAGQVQYVFPISTSIPAQGYLVIAAVPQDLQTVYGLATVLGPYTNALQTSGLITLHDAQDSVLLRLEYGKASPWPMGADGTGHSIVLARPSYGEGDPRAWDRSSVAGGSPGAAETLPASPLRNVVLNEILGHTDLPQVDAIELYNHGNIAVDLSGCTLSDDPQENKFVIPSNTVIAPRGFIFFTEVDMGFSLDAAGETLYFKNPNGTSVLDALRFGAQENGIGWGRFPNGSDWTRLRSLTFGTNNAIPLISPVGFNEIMYHPISGNDDEQYVELFNHGTNAVSLGGWKIEGGIDFTFPSNQVLAASNYLVVARDISRLMPLHPQLNAANTVGNFSGRLSSSGEHITLTKPDTIITTNGTGFPVTNLVDTMVDEVTYGTGGRWGRWADGGGSSLELIDPKADKRLASNWADSDETAKAPWTSIQTTGALDNGSSYTPLQVGLLDVGECLVDNLEAINVNGVNCVGNADFESGMSNLSFVGAYSRSSLATNSGYPAGGVALHVRAGDSLGTGPNAVQITLTNTSFIGGQVVTLRFKARWLRGCPEPLLRFIGCQLEAAGRLQVPTNLGTPGLPNSRLTTNAGPAIHQVRHDPAVPAANEPVVVTARISDPDGPVSLTVQYRFDPSTTTTNLAMNDTGSNGDVVANDGIYSATLPGRATNAIAFVLMAADAQGATSRFPELVPDNAPNRECVIFFGEPNPTNLFGTYHLWLTQTNVNRWKALPVMSNEDIDGTLVYNNRIIYNMGGRYSGSPFHQFYDGPAGNRACHYVWGMPKDDLLLGASSFNKIHWPGNDIQSDTITSVVNDATLQREQAAYMFMRSLGLPWSYHRLVAVYVNGTRRGKLMEDAFRPTGGTVKDQYLADDSGVQLYKLQRWYSGSSSGLISECLLQAYTNTGGAFKTARYRPNWALKESPGSLSDYTNAFALITAANAYNLSNYVALLENVVDMDNWMRMSAANHAVGNWDAFGSTSGQNVDAWVSDQHRWTLFTIDLGICLDNNISGVGLFSMSDSVWQRFVITPKFRRIYCNALNELVNGIMQANTINPILDAKYSAMVTAGVAPSAPTSTKSWIAGQRSSIISQLATLNTATFSLSLSNLITTSNSVTLTGSAPLAITSILINGTSYTPIWTTVTNWSLTVPVPNGTNSWTLSAQDRYGNAVGGALLVSVTNTNVPALPVGNVVFSEIMFNPTTPEGEYVELFNRSTNTPFDLSGWIINGLDYTFPPGSILLPQNRLVLARSRTAFAATYGALIPVFGTFAGNLQSDGETLSLIQPGATPGLDLVVDRVRYESIAPWPTAAATQLGTSLQLVDVAQDNSRVANWGVGQLPVSATRTPGSSNSVQTILPGFPTLWLNEVQVENLTGPADNFGERDPWLEIYNAGSNSVSLDGLYLGTNYNNPMQWPFPPGLSIAPGQFLVAWLDAQPGQSSGATQHANFRLNANSSSIALAHQVDGQPQIIDYLNFQPLPANQSYGDIPDGQPFHRQAMFYVSPAGTNSPAVPPLNVWINEWMADNTGWMLNPTTTKYDDWFELHNPTGTPANLSGYYLSDSLVSPLQYMIPAGFQVPAHGFLLVWADDNTDANTNGTDLHVPFKLSKSGEALGLFTPQGTAIDAVEFGAQTDNVSEGRYPDSASLKVFMANPSPRSPNILPAASGPPLLSGISIQPDQSCVVTFQASAGHVYRIEYKDDLTEANWHQLGTNHFATGTIQSFSDTPTGPHRFYRVSLVQ
jgi:hypothetical protein